jgi:hypothetical protein
MTYFIEKANKTHMGKYDYSKTNYINSTTKVTITCPIHGYFNQTPNSHLAGRGCLSCYKDKLFCNTEIFIEKANKTHMGKYDYSKTNYINSTTKVTITCPIHGYFNQTPNSHLAGHGCKNCANSLNKNFVVSANSKHNNKYIYEKTLYCGALKKVTITCPIHGDFNQTPNSHLTGHGCVQCGRSNIKKMSLEIFIEKANKTHMGKYDYSKTNYINSTTKVTITCPIHGDFNQTSSAHLFGAGCSICAVSHRAKTLSMSASLFIEKANKTHMGKYDYSKTNYINSTTKVTITCPIHGDFNQLPNNHLRNIGCPSCNESIGERLIDNVLKILDIQYIRQFRIPECKHILPLPFDFAIFKDKKMIGLIEYQGEQHFFPLRWYNNTQEQASNDFLLQKKRDGVKIQYCEVNNIPLLVVNYKDKNNTEKLLKNLLRLFIQS